MSEAQVLYRAGGMPTLSDTRNEAALWFDSLSADELARKGNFPRSETVFMALDIDSALQWVENRLFVNADADVTIWEVELPEGFEAFAYPVGSYDAAQTMRHSVWKSDNHQKELEQCVMCYWGFRVPLPHWRAMYGRCMEGYDDPHEYEVKIPFSVAQAASWTVFREHDEVLENSSFVYWQKAREELDAVEPHVTVSKAS